MKKSTSKHDREKMACTAKMGEKGQIVIPKNIRDMFDLHPGDTIIILADKKQGIAIPPKDIYDKITSLVFNQKENEISEEEE